MIAQLIALGLFGTGTPPALDRPTPATRTITIATSLSREMRLER